MNITLLILSLFLIGIVITAITFIIIYYQHKNKLLGQFSYSCFAGKCFKINQAPGNGKYSNMKDCQKNCSSPPHSSPPHSSPQYIT
jgi:hypothetical protein